MNRRTAGRPSGRVPRTHLGQRAAIGLVAAAVGLGFTAALALAVQPAKNALLSGPTSYRPHVERSVMYMRVSGTGTRLKKVVFGENCLGGEGPRLKNVKISSAGTFAAKRSYRHVIRKARGVPVPGGLADEVQDWKVTFAGKFVSATRAKGTFSWRLRDRLRDSSTGEYLPATEFKCHTGKRTWKAKTHG
jgi:hypothetical protein